jgi:hypothetical protein
MASRRPKRFGFPLYVVFRTSKGDQTGAEDRLVPRVVAAAAPTELMVAMVETTIATFSSAVPSKVCEVSFSNTIYSSASHLRERQAQTDGR